MPWAVALWLWWSVGNTIYSLLPILPLSLCLFFLCSHRREEKKGLFPSVTSLVNWLCSWSTKSTALLRAHPLSGAVPRLGT